jgi:hypothetical protein
MSRVGIVVVGVALASACSNSSSSITGSGGSTGLGGSAHGGSTGMTGSGGISASGGVTGSGGISASGGVTGSGGVLGSGGTVATGGNKGSGGSGGATGAGGKASGGATGSGGKASGGATGSGGAASGGSGGTGTAGAAGGSAIGGGGGHYTNLAVDLCSGMISDLQPHTMTALSKPAVGATVTDPQFNTTIRRITGVATQGAIVPMYSTISAWNADESRMILYQVGSGHQLYDGKSYQKIQALNINPADVEQVYWDTSNPDLFYYVDGQVFTRYHVSTGAKDKVHDFSSLCGSNKPTNGDDPMFTSWDSHRLGLVCGSKMFVYDQSSDTVLGPITPSGTPPVQVAGSGTLGFLEAGMGQIFSISPLQMVRSLTLQNPGNHASLGQLANGHDTWNGAVYDDGNDDAKSNVGNLVTWDLTNGSGGAIIGPKTGYPYPPDGHISAMAYRQPGWVFVSTIWVNKSFDGSGTPPTPGLLDMENLVANTNTGTVCRIGRHRSWGKTNTALTGVISYWAEPHTVPSPSGTRAVFASDWGNGTSVDSYVVELPSYGH